jgi:hypothetical protein
MQSETLPIEKRVRAGYELGLEENSKLGIHPIWEYLHRSHG